MDIQKVRILFQLDKLQIQEAQIERLQNKIDVLQELVDISIKSMNNTVNDIFDLVEEYNLTDEEFFELQEQAGIKL